MQKACKEDQKVMFKDKKLNILKVPLGQEKDTNVHDSPALGISVLSSFQS